MIKSYIAVVVGIAVPIIVLVIIVVLACCCGRRRRDADNGGSTASAGILGYFRRGSGVGGYLKVNNDSFLDDDELNFKRAIEMGSSSSPFRRGVDNDGDDICDVEEGEEEDDLFGSDVDGVDEAGALASRDRDDLDDLKFNFKDLDRLSMLESHRLKLLASSDSNSSSSNSSSNSNYNSNSNSGLYMPTSNKGEDNNIEIGGGSFNDDSDSNSSNNHSNSNSNSSSSSGVTSSRGDTSPTKVKSMISRLKNSS